mmetsp:Transcript_5752/g.7992  ORF Transcript_5752/g.7992 Transcript_5752/m.7992 type:complete len:270 (+) Transcript_5752:3-812(+)
MEETQKVIPTPIIETDSAEAVNSTPNTAKLKPGDLIEGNFRALGVWYPGRITETDVDGRSFDVIYEDGEKETGVAPTLLRRLVVDESQRFNEGDLVEGNYRCRGQWYRGKITRVMADENRYDVQYDDGEEEKAMATYLLRPAPVLPTVASPVGSNELVPGAAVEAFHSSGGWFPSRIAAVLSDGCFDILFEDGERDSHVIAAHVRSKPVSVALDVSQLQEGTAVEANYQGNSGWFPARVAEVNDDGTFDLLYDDGEFEEGVSRLMMRLL